MVVLASLLMQWAARPPIAWPRPCLQSGSRSSPPHPGLQPSHQRRLADRLPCASGRRRGDAQPGGDVDHPHVRRSARAGAGDRDWAAVMGVSIALGPVLGGVLVALSWRAVFLVNIPIGLAAIALTARFVPESAPRAAATPIWVGQVLVIVMLASLTTAIIDGPNLAGGRPRSSPSPSPRPRRLPRSCATTCAATTADRAALLRAARSARRRSSPSRRSPRSGTVRNTLYPTGRAGPVARSTRLVHGPLAGEMTVKLCGRLSGRVVGPAGCAALVVGGLGLGIGSLMLVERSSPGTSLAWLLAAYARFGPGSAP